MEEIKVNIIKHPSDEDWIMVKRLALNTVNKKLVSNVVNDDWKERILKAEHSPIRYLTFVIEMKIPYYSSVHFSRHKIGVEHYVQSQRNDRQNNYDRNLARQDTMVNHIMVINAQALIQMARRRLCFKADKTTSDIMYKICDEVWKTNPEFTEILVPDCLYRGGCCEMQSCGFYHEKQEWEWCCQAL